MPSQELIDLAISMQRGESTTPILDEAKYQRSRLDRAPEGERSFLANLSESFKRGQEGVLADVAVYEALHTEGEDITGTLIARKKLQSKAVLDPVEGNYLTSLVYKAANTAGQVLESAKRAGVGSVAGAAIGGVGGAVVGALIPTAGEEPVTVGTGVVAGAKLGAKVGGHGSAGIFMYKQGVGSMYADMLEQGIEPKTAAIAAHLGGIPYAAIEMAQFKLLGAPAKRILTGKVKSLVQAKALNAITKGVSTYAKTLAGEVTEELAQELVQIATEKGAEAYQEGGLSLDRQFLNDTVQRMLAVGKGATEAFALVPVPGAAFEAGVSWASAQLDDQTTNALSHVDAITRVAPKDVTDPEVQLLLVIRDKLGEVQSISEERERTNYEVHQRRAEESGKEPLDFITFTTRYRSNKLFREQEEARAAERAERLGKKAGTVRAESNFANFSKNIEAALKGDVYTSLGISPLEGALPLESFNALRQQIVSSTDKLQTMEAYRLNKALENLYFNGGKFQKSDWKVAAKVWGPNTVAMMKELSELSAQKVTHPLVTINDFARAVASSMDMSYTLRQNKFAVGKPKLFFKTFATQARILAKGIKEANIINRDLVTSDEGQAAIKAGVRYEEIGGGFERGSEAFPSKLAGRIPGIARSGAAFTTAGNYARIAQFGEIWRANRGSFTDKQLQDIAHVINIMSGIGDVSMLGKYAHVLNSVAFAPRNFFANVQVWTELFNPELSGVARKYLAWNLVKWASINAGVLASMSMVPGVSVERDPRSTDFGKIVIGKTHVDFWGGQLPIFRTLYRLARQQRKTAGGQIVDAPMKDTITRFLQSKLGPVPSAIVDIWKGEGFVGQSRKLDNVDDMSALVYEKITPFFIQDVIDALRLQGAAGLAFMPLSFLGASAQSYAHTKSTQAAIVRNELSREVLGSAWDELGPVAQKFMRTKFPEIAEAENAARYEREQNYFMSSIEKSLKASQAKMLNAMPRDVKAELSQLNVTLSGVSKRVGTDWYLNEKRYAEYESMVATAYKDVIPRLMRSQVWGKLNPIARVEVLKRVTEELKEGARKNIILKANMDDLKRVRYTP